MRPLPDRVRRVPAPGTRAAAQRDTQRPATPATAPTGFRPDIEGLRAVAVLSVMAYHAGLPFVPGGFSGVDVFFVLSGFLITGQLLKEVRSTGTVDLPAFYGRRFKRLLPAATLVLAFTAVASWLLLPSTRWREMWGDVAASALYVVNWRLADRSTDYLAEDSQPSPVQHYWSLAVEEQFYVVWPLVLLGVAMVVRRQRTRLGPTAVGGLLLIGLPSFAWSLWATAHTPESAYFVTTTRLWELVVGAVVACGAGFWPRLRRPAASGLVLLGVVLVLAGFFLVTPATPWPGSAALLPTLGTAMVVAGGVSGGGVLLAGLRSAPMVWVGGLSYSLYLWHWPLVVLVDQGPFDGDAPLWATLLAVLVAVPAAWAGHRLVENPVRFAPAFKRTRNALLLGAGLTGVTAAAALVAIGSQRTEPAVDLTVGHHGAEQLLPDPGAGSVPADVEPVVRPEAFAADPASITPAPTTAVEDVPPTHARGCHVTQESPDPVECRFGDPEGDVVVAVAGDSKADQWLPALDDWARRRGYLVVSYTKSSCTWADAPLTQHKGYASCMAWGAGVRERLTALEPDVLVVSGGAHVAFAGGETREYGVEPLVAGYERNWRPLAERGTRVVALLDVPVPPTKVYECVAEHRQDVTACDWPAAEGKGSPPLRGAVDRVEDATVVDLNDFLCPEGTCRAVVGGVLTYRQGAHVTASWVRSMQKVLDARFDAALEGHVPARGGEAGGGEG
ncbi:acyltransferase family protein [Kytococcus schroeteri]|uniref:acyltransferase family protein n=1 Tax=Kytococcus schroeteri TaxID=138300 RepID=UPI0035EC70E3